jgi:hypothetical protein
LDVGERPLLNNLRKSLIDPDTPEEALTKKNLNGKEMKLVVGISPSYGSHVTDIGHSFRMSLMFPVERSLRTMIHISRPLICGME